MAGAAFRVTLIPEPATLSLFGLAMIGLVGAFPPSWLKEVESLER